MNITVRLALLACLVFLVTRDGFAREVQFPTTPEDIARALAPAPSRGLGGVVDDQPRVGAIVLFDFDSDRVRSESLPLLDSFGEVLAGPLSSERFLVVGHTDALGGREYNRDLSLRRALAIKRYLVERHGVYPARLDCQGRGDEEPLSPNTDEAGRARNRRVEFIREQR